MLHSRKIALIQYIEPSKICRAKVQVKCKELVQKFSVDSI